VRSQVRTQHANNIQSAATHTRSRKIRSRAGAIAFVTLPPAPSVLPRSLLLERGNAGPLQPRKEWERMEPRALRPEAPAASLSSSGQAEGSTAVILEDSAGREHDCGRLPSKCRERRRPRSNPRHLSQANQFFLHRRSPCAPARLPAARPGFRQPLCLPLLPLLVVRIASEGSRGKTVRSALLRRPFR
jgi:hypothetical protein